MTKTCIQTSTVGKTLKLTITVTSGTAPFDFTFKKGGAIIKSVIDSSDSTYTHTYTLTNDDIGTIRFQGDTTDYIGKIATEYCDIVVSAVVTTGVLSFSSSPYGAKIYIDDVDQGKTTSSSPINISVPSGITHTWKLTLSGYNNATGSQLVAADQTYTINPTLTPNETSINLTINGNGRVVAYKRLSTSDTWTKIGETTSTTTLSYANLYLFKFEAFPNTGYNFKEYKTNFNLTVGTASITEGLINIDNNGLSLCTDRCYYASTLTAYFVTTPGICNWIMEKGGWTNIIAYNIMELVSAYSGATSLGFTVTAAHIMGAVAYYSDNLSSGNLLTGCTFI